MYCEDKRSMKATVGRMRLTLVVWSSPALSINQGGFPIVSEEVIVDTFTMINPKYSAADTLHTVLTVLTWSVR